MKGEVKAMNKKLKLTAAITSVAALSIIGGTFAFFSSSDEILQEATAGSVKVDVSDILFENPTNINPGDNDPTLPDDPDRPDGTSHKITFDVENIGTKSIRTKHEITITMKDPTLDPSVFHVYDMEDNELVKKYYKVDGNYLTQEEYDAIEDDKFCTEVKYVVASDIFDGVGMNSEKEEVSTVKEENDIAKQSYTYQFAMSQDATDEYQGENVEINVAVFSIQYRNMDASDWYKISEENIEGFTS